MRVVIAGGHGQIALHLEQQLSEHGDQPIGLIRNPEHAGDLAAAGAEADVADLESTSVQLLADVMRGADAAVFAAGAGPGSSIERKKTVDLDGAVLLANACVLAAVRRLVVISAIGADRADDLDDTDDNGEPNVFKVYLKAKAAADSFVRDSGLDWTVVRPGGLTDETATGLITAGEQVERGQIPRADVAAVVLGVLQNPSTVSRQFDVVSGSTPIAAALASL